MESEYPSINTLLSENYKKKQQWLLDKDNNNYNDISQIPINNKSIQINRKQEKKKKKTKKILNKPSIIKSVSTPKNPFLILESK